MTNRQYLSILTQIRMLAVNLPKKKLIEAIDELREEVKGKPAAGATATGKAEKPSKT